MPAKLNAAVAALMLTLAPSAPEPPNHDAWARWEQNRGDGTVIRSGIRTPEHNLHQPARFTESRDEPGEAAGGGDGGDSQCSWVPVGPLAEVRAAQAAINAGQLPDVSDPAVDGALALVPGVLEGFAETDWYRVTGNSAEVYHRLRCPDGTTRSLRWWALVPDGAGNLVPRITARDLVPGARDEVVRQLPTPVPRIAPADEDSQGHAFVNMRTFFFVDHAPGQWHPVSATASAAGITVTVTAEPVRLRVDPGDGQAPITCDGAPTIVTRATYRPDITGCAHTYTDSSAMAPDGRTWPVTMSIVWHATWDASTGERGDLGYVATTADTRDLPVAEIQAVVTRVDS